MADFNTAEKLAKKLPQKLNPENATSGKTPYFHHFYFIIFVN
jgi:hypothetical protein